MLSYRHAFHAGNHADVLKHWIEVLLLQHLSAKDKPWWYIDTHAGAGLYRLTEGYAARNAEFESGIARLWQRDDLPPAFQAYLDIVRGLNPDGALRHYPGSPWIAQALARNQDRLRLFELHPSDCPLLEENFGALGKLAQVRKEDGFSLLKSLLPPPPRRALILIDPPYEEKQDYRRVVDVLRDALKRFATGTYAVWYPRLTRLESERLPAQLKQLPASDWLHVALDVQAPAEDGFGMFGSGMFILNPPWTLKTVLEENLPFLVSVLAQNAKANFKLDSAASGS